MMLDQFKHTAPMSPFGCLDCGRQMADLSRWDGEHRVTVWRCISKECRMSIFSPVKVPAFNQMRIL